MDQKSTKISLVAEPTLKTLIQAGENHTGSTVTHVGSLWPQQRTSDRSLRCRLQIRVTSMGIDDDEQRDPSLHLIGTGGEHGLGREVLCSLPRAISCRLCKGEQDCPYIVERPLGRIIVRKREPESLVIRDLMYVATGSTDSLPRKTPLRQKIIGTLSWVAIPVLLAWVIFIHKPQWAGLILPAAVMLATFFFTIIGVPIVRWFWRDHGGKRRGGAWRPS